MFLVKINKKSCANINRGYISKVKSKNVECDPNDKRCNFNFNPALV